MSDKKNIFGISLKSSVPNLNPFFKAVDVSAFKIFEVSGDFVNWFSDADSHLFNLNKARFNIISVSNIIPPNIAGEIAGRPFTIQSNFFNSFREIMKLLHQTSIKYCTMDINLDKELANSLDYEKKVFLMKKLTPQLFFNKVNMLLPIRIPSVLNINLADYPLFSRKIMNPNFEFALDIHPHEFRVKPEPLEMLKPLRFKIGLVSFEYEPESGNYFVPKLLEPWLEALELLAYNGPILLAPRTSKSEVFAAEIPKLVNFVEALNGEFQ
jgi:hypothetical protein